MRTIKNLEMLAGGVVFLFIIGVIVLIIKGKEYPNNITQKVEVHKDSCYYKVNQYWKRDNTLCCSVYVLAPCGLYNDGDTLGRSSVMKDSLAIKTITSIDLGYKSLFFFIEDTVIYRGNSQVGYTLFRNGMKNIGIGGDSHLDGSENTPLGKPSADTLLLISEPITDSLYMWKDDKPYDHIDTIALVKYQ